MRSSSGVNSWSTHIFLYVNDVALAVDSDLLSYADHSCLIFRDKSIESEIGS